MHKGLSLFGEMVVLGERSSNLVIARDQFIAKRIDTTLGENATALLFLGAEHDPTKYFPPDTDIEIDFLDPRLKEIGREIDHPLREDQEGQDGPQEEINETKFGSSLSKA